MVAEGAGKQVKPAVSGMAKEKAGQQGVLNKVLCFKWSGQGSPHLEGGILTKELQAEGTATAKALRWGHG